jgi:4-amino-4-deoxy-L-arabinose transferase-like glycosyltransferase
MPGGDGKQTQFWMKDIGFWTILIVAALLFFTRFRCPLQEPQEARYAEIPRQMLEEGRFVVPVLHGQPYYDKPPLLYWLVMASYSVFGVHDWAARLVACTAGFICVAVTYGWGRKLGGRRTAFAGALILCLAPRFVQLDRLLTMDGLLCLWVVTAWATAHVALTEERCRWCWWLASAVACGLGLLTKGPVASVLVFVPLLAIRRLDPRVIAPSGRMVAAYVLAALGLAAPWYVAVALRDETFLDYFFWFHHVQRFVEPFDHAEPFWFYLPVLFLGMLPWTVLLFPLIRSLFQSERRCAWGTLGFCLCAALWCLLFFSLAGCKRSSYILPAMPPLALALGSYLERSLSRISIRYQYRARRGWQVSCVLCGAVIFAVLLAAVYLLLPAYARAHSLRGQVRRHALEYADSKIPVICYPRRWDSVSYYLQRNDVQSYGADQLPDLLAELTSLPEALLFVKHGQLGSAPSEDLLRQLPACVKFEPLGRQGALMVGRIVRKNQ